MKKKLAVTICTGAALDIVLFLFAFKPNVLWQFLSILLFFVMLVILIADLVFIPHQWKRYRFKAFLPFCAASLFLVIIPPSMISGYLLQDHLFRSRIPQYEAVLEMMMDGSIDVGDELRLIELPPEYSSLASRTMAQKDSNGILTVEFIIGGGFPVKHSGYLFRSEGKLQDWEHAARWPRRLKIDEHWYRISD
jgi:hypothetical protein